MKRELTVYQDLLLKWQKKINLIGRSTLPNIVERHFLDSMQVLSIVPEDAKTLIDLGSGAGFPGMVIAMTSSLEVTLIESDSRKCAFLQEISRCTKTPVRIICERIEKVHGLTADIITARALADLEKLLKLSKPFTHERSWCIFHKGKKIDQEILAAEKKWSFSFEKIGGLVKIKDIRVREHVDHFDCKSKGRCGENHHGD